MTRRSDTGLGAARAYHPRGRTVRDRQRPAATAERDPLRSALKVFDDEPVDGRDGDREGRAGRTAGGGGRDGSARARDSGSGGRDRGAGGRDGGARARDTGAGGRDGGAAGGAGRPAAKPTPRAGGRTGGKPAAKPATAPARQVPRQARVAAPRRPAPQPNAPARGKPAGGVPRKPARPRRAPALANPRRRLRLATVLTLTLFAVLAMRLIELQLTDGPAYAAEGLQDRLTEVTLPAERGAIYDRNGNVLAHSVEARFVYADPELVTDPPRVAEALQPLLGIPASDLVNLMRRTTLEDGRPSRFAWLARGVDIATADAIMALNLPGINVDRDERRIVPGNDLAANLIGFTGEDQSGLEGLEAAFDDALRGVDGERVYEGGQGASLDRPIPGGYEVETPPQPGSDLRLTIDMDLQYEVQRVLAEQLRERSATFGAAVVLDVHTGQVLAQASYPTYNAADPLAAPEEVRVDAATATVFDPGSAHKPLVIGAALEEGVIEPGDSLVINPTIVKGDEMFADVIGHPAGTRVGLSAILAFSSNVGTIMIADQLGKERLYQYQQAFGLGTPTGIGVPGEASGALLAPEDWYSSSYGSVPIGHSVDVTTVQMAAAYGAIANDGVWVQPQLVQAVVGPDGVEQAPPEPTTRRVLSPDTAAYLREIMESVTTVPGATGLNAAVENYRVAGKTGTGSLVTGGEYADGEVASFVGMAPAEAPRYVIAVVAHTPRGGGGEVASPAFQEMMSFTLNHYRVPPASAEPPAFDLFPSSGR